MASIANAVLDDDLIGDGDSAFIGGQVSATVENAIPKGSYCLGQNVDLDPFGRLTTRRGARTITGNVESRDWEDISANWEDITLLFGNTLGADAIDAAFYYDTYASEVAVIAQGGALKYGTEGGAYATIASATYSGADVYFAQLNNRLYFCDGVGALKYVDSSYAYSAISAGRVSSIRVTHPGSGYTSAPAITFSSGAGVATALLAYGGRVIGATIDTAGSGYSATTPPTISFAAPGSGGNTATGIVNITQLPAKPKYLVSHTNRLFAASADTAVPPDTVYASYFLDGEAWDLAGASIRVGGDGDPITGLFSWTGNLLLVLKQRSIWIVDTDPLVNPADWVQKQITGRVGCVSHRSVQPVGSDVFFLSQDGVRSLRQIESGTKTEVGQPLSAPIQDQIDRINKAALSKVCAAFYRNRYFLAVPQDGDTVPKTVLVWDELRKCWLGPWTGWQPRDFCVTGFSGRVRLNTRYSRVDASQRIRYDAG